MAEGSGFVEDAMPKSMEGATTSNNSPRLPEVLDLPVEPSVENRG